MNGIFNIIEAFKPKTSLESVLGYISKYKTNNIFKTAPLSDESFNIGRYHLQFGENGSKCIFKIPGDTVPMFMFDDIKDIFTIRRMLGLSLAVSAKEEL